MIEVNQKRMEALMHDFHTLTGMRIVLFDDEQREIMAYPPQHCAFCQRMREDPAFYARCVASDRAAFRRSRGIGQPIVYVCHAGLTEAVLQIREGDTAAGYIMFGQVIPRESEEDTRLRLAKRIPCGDALLQTVTAMPSKSSEEIHAASTILDALSIYLWTNRLVALPKGEFIDMLNLYIDQHVSESITAGDLCTFFGIGHTQLYKLAANHLECSLARYIRKRRIHHASALLRDTPLPITEIAARTGFSEYNHFSRVFRETTGDTARRYRQRAQVGPQK